jgi:hypothetical protein
MKDTKGHEDLGLAAACGGRLMGVSARKRKRRGVARMTDRSRFRALTPIS